MFSSIRNQKQNKFGDVVGCCRFALIKWNRSPWIFHRKFDLIYITLLCILIDLGFRSAGTDDIDTNVLLRKLHG